jgi:ubiquinone/menaquinone biosynthesis C-methylase UbiE
MNTATQTKPSANANTTPDFTAIKTKQQATWGSGNYGRIGVTLQITGEQLCEAMDLRAGHTVLDVAGGNGNATLAAAHRGCFVTSTDYVDSLLGQSRQRADAEFLSVQFQQADAENLPFEDARFNNVVSTFGVMFTPNQVQAAAELQRVCRPGGKIGLANWTPDGFIGQLFKTIGKHVPPPAGVSSPAAWGTDAFLQGQFGANCQEIIATTRQFNFRYESPEQFVEIFKTYYGPTLKAFQALGEDKGQVLQQDIVELIGRFNRAKDGSMVVPSDYLEVVITR